MSINLQNGIRRSISFDFINIGGKYNPNPTNGNIWVTSKIKLWLGLSCADRTLFFPAGVFVIKDPQQVSNYSDQRVSISANDKYCLIDNSCGGTLTDFFSIPAGTSFPNAVKMLLNLANDNVPPIIPSKFNNFYTPTDIRKSRGDKIDDSCKNLAGWVSCYYYYNENGSFCIEDTSIDDKIKSNAWDFTTNEYEYQGSAVITKSSEIYNQVYVTGGNVNGSVVTATATDDNLLSPFNVNWMPVRVKTVSDDIIATVADAQARAKYELKQYLINQKTINMSSTYMCHLNVGDVIGVTDPNIELNRYRFLVKSLQIPLTTASKIQIGAVSASELDVSVA